MVGAVERQGLTLVPLELYFKKGRAKVALALGKGKKQHDKREDLKRRIVERETARAVSPPGSSMIAALALLAVLAGGVAPRAITVSTLHGDQRSVRSDRGGSPLVSAPLLVSALGAL